MKTHIIQPETHDDLISVLDLISWSKSPRLVLVLPAHQNIIHTKVDLIRLHRKAKQQGAMLGLVTRNRQILELAAEVGVPVFPTIHKADTATWRKNWKGEAKTSNERARSSTEELKSKSASFQPKVLPDWLRITVFLLGVAAVFALAFLFIPRAEVDIQAASSQQVLDLEIKASEAIPAPDLAGNIPLYTAPVTVEAQGQVRTTGSQLVPKTFSSCEVVFSNLQSESVKVPVGTVVLTLMEPVERFATIRDVTVAGGIGSTSSAEVEALQPGEVGNAGAEQVTAIEGAVGVNLKVYNPDACSGGTDELAPISTDSDLAVLRADVKKQLISAAAEMLISQMDEEIVVIGQNDPEITILNMELQPGLGVAAEYLQLTEKASVTLTYYLKEDIHNAITLSMDAILEPGMKGIEGSLVYKDISLPAGVEEPYRWKINAVRDVTHRIDPGEIALRLRGLPVDGAAAFLNQLPGITAESSVSIFPRWWKNMPYLSYQIKVNAP